MFKFSDVVSRNPNIHILDNEVNVGDKNQALALQNAIKELYLKEGRRISIDETHCISIKNLDDLQQSLSSLPPSENIIIGAGSDAIKAFNKLSTDEINTANATLIWAGHQVFTAQDASVSSLVDKVAVIALPGHAISEEQVKEFSTPKTHVIQTLGVMHTLTNESLKCAYAKFEKETPELAEEIAGKIAGKNVIVVVLGGDAPDANGTQHFFTPKEAATLAEHIAELASREQAVVLVTNGPRTGKFDPESNLESPVIANDHKNNTHIDATTEAFTRVLNGHNIEHHLSNFIFGKTSAYNALLHVAKEKNGQVFVTGESTSMVSEMRDVLPKETITVVTGLGCINVTHQKHIDAEYAAGNINLYDVPSRAFLPKNPSTETQRSAVATAAETIFTLLNPRLGTARPGVSL